MPEAISHIPSKPGAYPREGLVALLVTCLLLFSMACSHSGQRSPTSSDLVSPTDGQPRVVLISIDGLRPDFYLSKETAVAPNLTALAKRGLYTDGMEGIFPTLTYPTHTSIITGVPSAQHGVLGNTIFSMEHGPTNEWNWYAAQILTPTLWDRAKKAGKSVGIIRWPVSIGAKVDWFVPEIFYAPGFSFEKDWQLIQQNTQPELLAEILDGSGLTPTKGFLSLRELDRFTAHSAIKILRDHAPHFTLLHLVNLDIVQHSTGRSSPQTYEALREIDDVLGSILSVLDLKKFTVIVVGDHGFRDYRRMLHLNSLFREQGWQKTSAQKLVQWQVAAHAEGGQAAIYIRDSRLKPSVLKVLRKNAQDRYRIIETQQLHGSLSAYPQATFALEATTDYAFGTNWDGPFETHSEKTKGAHGHLPSHPELKTGFITLGSEVKGTGSIGPVHVLQVTPTIAQIFGLPSLKTDQKPIQLRRPAVSP